ncbi:SIR2 family protein [Porticoccus sp. W117]|uniref:SIR2 family NAD-dependent protein deacylase n=1 Tax=Porticoccus sp. W117 TaxID=3054777 RepID=UPI00259A512E|nr:SIR2 family protein [Porticoccus sp. W117]MDM3871377.1 SIR2 family protein [Porticoccus sp. W117]
MEANNKTWCERDEHHEFEYYLDFNRWLDLADEESAGVLLQSHGLENIRQPSKALFASDKPAYDMAFREYRIQRRNEVLSRELLEAIGGDDHWYNRNEERFLQLVGELRQKTVVPFVGAGISVAAGFPTWKDHLRQQGKTAGIANGKVENLLEAGKYEQVIHTIEEKLNADVFAQEIRDVFQKKLDPPEVVYLLTQLFGDTLITTNYDQLIETAYQNINAKPVQLINATVAEERPDGQSLSVVKLHGHINIPQRCIISANQYDLAYGQGEVDLSLPIPKLLGHHYRNSSLLFLGCSLNNDRTIQVFRKVKGQMPDVDRPQHFSIEQAPNDVNELTQRNASLLELGITPIWYEQGNYESVEALLQHAKHEVEYQGGFITPRALITDASGFDENERGEMDKSRAVTELFNKIKTILLFTKK